MVLSQQTDEDIKSSVACTHAHTVSEDVLTRTHPKKRFSLIAHYLARQCSTWVSTHTAPDPGKHSSYTHKHKTIQQSDRPASQRTLVNTHAVTVCTHGKNSSVSVGSDSGCIVFSS